LQRFSAFRMTSRSSSFWSMMAFPLDHPIDWASVHHYLPFHFLLVHRSQLFFLCWVIFLCIFSFSIYICFDFLSFFFFRAFVYSVEKNPLSLAFLSSCCWLFYILTLQELETTWPYPNSFRSFFLLHVDLFIFLGFFYNVLYSYSCWGLPN
jgi:hypothetical protein